MIHLKKMRFKEKTKMLEIIGWALSRPLTGEILEQLFAYRRRYINPDFFAEFKTASDFAQGLSMFQSELKLMSKKILSENPINHQT